MPRLFLGARFFCLSSPTTPRPHPDHMKNVKSSTFNKKLYRYCCNVK